MMSYVNSIFNSSASIYSIFLFQWHSLTKCPVQKVGASSPERPTKLYIFMVTLIPILFRSCISGCDTHDKNIVTSLAICDTEAGVPVKQPNYKYF